MSAPTFSGLDSSVTFDENTLNLTPRLLDANVSLTGSADYAGGTLTVSGALALDVVSIRSEGTGAGQIGFSGGTVTYGGIIIGTAAGGAGSALTVTFSADATSPAVEALIENLTFANSSDAPGNRTLKISLIDGHGQSPVTDPVPVLRNGDNSPFTGIDLVTYSTPTFGDVDGDGDLDLISGRYQGTLDYFENIGTATAPVLAAAVALPIDVGERSAPALADLDHDGDLDLVVGNHTGTLSYYLNTGTPSAPVFTQQNGSGNPFDGIDIPDDSTPTFGDIDGDGDFDLLVGGKAAP